MGSVLKMRVRQVALLAMLSILLSLVVAQPAAAAQRPAAAAATFTTVYLDVKTAVNSISSQGPKKGSPVTQYHWLLNLDNTGDPYTAQQALYCHPSTNVVATASTPVGDHGTYVATVGGYPNGCEWPSVRYAVASPALSEGTQADWNNFIPGTSACNSSGGASCPKALPAFNTTYGTGLPNNCPTIAQPTKACRYLITITANGYQIGGVHFAVPSPTSVVSIYLNPFPLPLGTIRLKAFDDSSPTDGTYDEATETGLVGFHGILNDVDGIVQADYFGNPLCTEYLKYQNTHSGAPGYTTNASLVGKVVLQSNGLPTALPPHDPAPKDPKTGYYNPTVAGDCLSDTNGDIVIPNMAPNHYSANVTPPIGDKTNWIQTTTLEGNHDFDVWTMPNDTGLDTELVVGGEPVPFVQFGFAHQLAVPTAWSCSGNPGTNSSCGRITGQLYQANSYVPGYGALPGTGGANGTSGIKLQNPIDRGWVALNSLNASTGDYDKMVATIPTQDPSRPDVHYPDCPTAPTYANPTTAGWGCFEFSNVPDGEYMLTVWDEPQDTALDTMNVTVSNGQIINMGVLPLLGWFSHVFGRICVDTNANGRCDPGEKGIFHQTVQNLSRTNNSMVGGINTSDTDANGYYDFKEAYPLGLMSINQFFFLRFKTTGVTWQACNDPQEHTAIAPMVDVSYLPMIGQCGRLDWAVVPYSPSANGDNGGVVATQREDYIRQKYNARQAQTLDFQTGIPGFTFEQYTPIKGSGPGGTDTMSGYAINTNGSYCTQQGVSVGATDNPQYPNCGNYTQPALAYISENNAGPAQCFPQDANGKPIGYDPTKANSYNFMVSGGACVESGASGTQFGLGTDNSSHPVQTVDGNYTLGNIPQLVPAAQLGDVLVKNISPVDNVLPAGYCESPKAAGIPYEPPCKKGDTMVNAQRPLFSTTTEEDVNLFNGAQYIPQGANTNGLVWPPRPGPADQMPNDPSKPAAGYDENQYTYSPGPDAICAGVTHVVHVTNKTLLANGGSPLEGATRHLCDTKLLNIQAGMSIAPDFHMHTVVDIPLPAHFWGYIVDDISVETNTKSTNLGEVHGLPNVPVGVYDWTGRRTYSVTSDYNGVWEVLMPSTDIFNCPVPAGTCPNVYRFVGNDPGQPAHPNLNYDPNYRTISANFEAWPNMLVPADTAPTRIVTGLEGPGVQFTSASPCGIKALEPQLFAVGPDPYVSTATATLTINGVNFAPPPPVPGVVPPAPVVTYKPDGGGALVYPTVKPGWTDRVIQVAVGNSVMPLGSGTLSVTNTQGLTTTNGVAFHVTKPNSAYDPHIITVGRNKMFDPFLVSGGQLVHPYPIQEALDSAASQWRAYWTSHTTNANDPKNQWLVVVYPHWSPTIAQNTAFVPLGTYFENVIIHSPLALQGIGPGGAYADGGVVQGSIIDGRFWSQITPGQFDTPGPVSTEPGLPENLLPTPLEPNILHWVNLLATITTNGTGFTAATTTPWSGGQDPGEGAVVTTLGTTGTYPTNYRTGVDGFTISGGDLSDFPGNLNEVSGTRVAPFPESGPTDESAGALSVQGGAVFVNGGTDKYNLTNNLVKQNQSAYGTVRFGTEFQVDPRMEGGASHNYSPVVSHNTFVANGGTNLAGALGIYDNTNGYSIDHNTFCMNASAEYGGAVSHFGYSPDGSISYNRMFLNSAFDEGGAIVVGSEPAFMVVTTAAGDTLAIPDPKGVTMGTGAVSIHNNYLSDNMAQDDGGAMRVMGTAGSQGLSPISIYNNVITNNVTGHEGGAISLADAPVVDIVNNTIAHNVSTATASTSSGQPAPAGIAVDTNSGGLTAFLAASYPNDVPAWMGTATWPGFSNPRISNDILWYNRAGSWAGSGVAGIGLPGDPTAMNFWDVGSSDASALLKVSSSVIGSSATASGQQYIDGGGNVTGAPPTSGLCSNNPADTNWCGSTDPTVVPPGFSAYNMPQLVNPYATILSIAQQRTYFRFRPAAIVSVDLPASLFDVGTYGIAGTSPALNLGFNPTVTGRSSVLASVPSSVPSYVPRYDILDRLRPTAPNPVDAGAYQVTGVKP